MGKPNPKGLPTPEYIGCQERTWRTETSQYLQEEKATAIPKVVASEMGIAQTGCMSSPLALCVWGCGTGPEEAADSSESYKTFS